MSGYVWNRELLPPLDYEPHIRMGTDRARVVLFNREYGRWFQSVTPDTYYSALNVMNMARHRHRMAMIQRQRAEREQLHLRHLAERKQPR